MTIDLEYLSDFYLSLKRDIQRSSIFDPLSYILSIITADQTV